jgi:hypothetical protein
MDNINNTFNIAIVIDEVYKVWKVLDLVIYLTDKVDEPQKTMATDRSNTDISSKRGIRCRDISICI